MATSKPAPFQITVQGNSEIPHPAERAIVNLKVSSSGPNKAAVSDEVITTAKHIESLLRDLGEASEDASNPSPLSHWSKKSLTSSSHVAYDRDGEARPKKFSSKIPFDIRFKDFKALGAFGAKVSALPHVEVQDILWTLTPATEKSFKSQLRKDAAKDAIEKARDYCEATGCGNLVPVELSEGNVYMPTTRSGMVYAARFASAGISEEEEGNEEMLDAGPQDEDLEFEPQEIKMILDVTMKFWADFPR
ncbi:hypothetical protein AC578_1022 [Pseudocercospora eumusae]|uniref:Uncharacterized protein n=1 Tax=Pseudocercospora eumusae TaxID=321146 RepID=A0A139HTH2_9PEZI|nr:hypothetical protein AC578_1022 [Pseudocercospora eumusae]